MIAALAANEKKYADYKAQVGATNEIKKVDLKGLRGDIRLLKASPGFTETIGRNLGIVKLAPSPSVTSTDKAVATAEARTGGGARIRWKKGGLAGVNVYMRRQGETEWRLLGRDNGDRCDYDPEGCRVDGFDLARAQPNYALKATRMVLDACVAPPPCAPARRASRPSPPARPSTAPSGCSSWTTPSRCDG